MILVVIAIICVCVYAFIPLFSSSKETQENTHINKVQPIDGVITEEDMEDYVRWSMEREEFKSRGTRGNSSRLKSLTGRIVFGLVLNIFLFGPCFAIFTLLNDGDGPIPYLGFDNILFAIREEGSIMPLFIVAIICILAIIGIGCIIGWFVTVHSDESGDAWMKKEIERSEKMLAIAEQKIKEQYEDKYNKLLEEKNSLESNLLLSKAEKDSNKQIADEQIKDYKKKLKELQQDYSREKKIWGLEKREMQYQLRLSKGLAKEVKDSDSPLGGLYGEED